MIKDMIQKLAGIKDSLLKWERQGSLSMVNREAHYQALTAVKDHVLKYVAKLVEDMKNEEVKHIPVAGGELTVRKIMADMYSGTIRKGDQLIHQFDRITIPQLAGQLQSLLELYDPDKVEEGKNPNALLIEKLKPIAERAEGGMVSQLLTMLAGQQVTAQASKEPDVDPKAEIMAIIEEANAITEAAKTKMQVVDPKVELQLLKERVQAMLARVESIVMANAPGTAEDDKLIDTLHEMQQKHDLLTDRVQQELKILDDRIKSLSDGVAARSSGKTITITVG